MSSEVRCWYLNQKGKATGPYAFSDLKSMAAQGSLKGHDLVFREGSAEWKRAYDWPELVQECFSDENRSSLSRLIKLPEEERAVEDQWVLLVREDGEKEVRFRQKGPFHTDEIRRMLVDEKIKPSDHIWKKGAARWVPLYDVPEFRVHNLKMTKAAEAALNQVASMPDLAQAHADPFAALMPATPDQAGSAPVKVAEPAPVEPVEAVPVKAEPVAVVEAAPIVEPAKKTPAVRASIPSMTPASEAPAPSEAKDAAVDVVAAKPALETAAKSAHDAAAKPAHEAAAKPSEAKAETATPDRQAIREWALGLVGKAQKEDLDAISPGRAQVFSPEVTKTDHEISVVANPAPAPQSPSPQSLAKPTPETAKPIPEIAKTAVEPMPLLNFDAVNAEEPVLAETASDISPLPLEDDEPEEFVMQPLPAKAVNVADVAKVPDAADAVEARDAAVAAMSVVDEKPQVVVAPPDAALDVLDLQASLEDEAPVPVVKVATPEALPVEAMDVSAVEEPEIEVAAPAPQASLPTPAPALPVAPAVVSAAPAAEVAPVATRPALPQSTVPQAVASQPAASQPTASPSMTPPSVVAQPAAPQVAISPSPEPLPAKPPQPAAPQPAAPASVSTTPPRVVAEPAPAVSPVEETPSFSDELTPIPQLPVPGVEKTSMPIFATSSVVPDDGSAEEIINPARLSESYSFETKSAAAKAAAEKGKIPVATAPTPAAVPTAPTAPKAGTPAKTPAAVAKAAVVATPAPAGAAVAKAPVGKENVGNGEFSYDFEPPKTFFSKAAPFFGVMVIAIFGAGVWATLNTDKSVFQSSSSASQIPFVTNGVENSATEPLDVPVPVKNPPKLAQAPPSAPSVPTTHAQTQPAPEDDGPEMIVAEPPPVAVATPTPAPKVEPAPAPAPQQAASPAADFDGKNPIVRINPQNNFLEIMGPFRKGELLRIRIEGRAGQILDLPALVQKYEVRAVQDHYYRVSVKDARIPKGEYLVAVQFGMNRFSRGVGHGKDGGFREALQGHRKAISYDQQQERKRLLQATKDFAQLLAKAETSAKDAGAIKTLQRELDKKTPRELRLVRTNRYELIFFDYWEKLAAQWERVQVTMKDNPGRNPASVGEFSRARKMAASLENEVRATSIWN